MTLFGTWKFEVYIDQRDYEQMEDVQLNQLAEVLEKAFALAEKELNQLLAEKHVKIEIADE